MTGGLSTRREDPWAMLAFIRYWSSYRIPLARRTVFLSGKNGHFCLDNQCYYYFDGGKAGLFSLIHLRFITRFQNRQICMKLLWRRFGIEPLHRGISKNGSNADHSWSLVVIGMANTAILVPRARAAPTGNRPGYQNDVAYDATPLVIPWSISIFLPQCHNTLSWQQTWFIRSIRGILPTHAPARAWGWEVFKDKVCRPILFTE